MKEFHVKLIMSDEFTITAEAKEEAIKVAKDKFGCDCYIDDVEVRGSEHNLPDVDTIL